MVSETKFILSAVLMVVGGFAAIIYMNVSLDQQVKAQYPPVNTTVIDRQVHKSGFGADTYCVFEVNGTRYFEKCWLMVGDEITVQRTPYGDYDIVGTAN